MVTSPVTMDGAKGLGGGACASNSAIGIGFGFNNPDFSDRVLRIEVTSDPPESKVMKRTRSAVRECQHDNGSPSRRASRCKVKTLQICALILASKSRFFHKLFTNGMRESKQQAITLSIHESEEHALLDLLKFLYDDSLKANTPVDLSKVLVLADRYEVDQCISYCAQMLSSLPMTFELALSCLNLPSSIIEGDNSHLWSLLDTSKGFISANFSTHREATLNLSLGSVEDILSWDSLEVVSEDKVYEFLLEWARSHYKDLNERRHIFTSRLFRLVRFPYMSCQMLKGILQCEELEQGDDARMVLEALLSMSGNHLSQVVSTSSCPRRAYKRKPIEVTMFDRPLRECIVYMELRKDECVNIKKTGSIFTQDICIGNESFYLEFDCEKDDSPDGFVISLHRNPSQSTINALMIDTEVAVRLEAGKYVVQETYSSDIDIGGSFWFGIGDSWELFMDEDSEYFIDDILFIRFTITIPQ